MMHKLALAIARWHLLQAFRLIGTSVFEAKMAKEIWSIRHQLKHGEDEEKDD